MKYSINFMIPLRPPSVNSLYNVFRYGQRLEVKKKPEVVKFQSDVKGFIPPWKFEHKDELLFFAMTFYDTEYFFKNGALRKFDITNTEKALLDAICDKIGIDDKFVKHRVLQHEKSKTKDFMTVEIGVMETMSK